MKLQAEEIASVIAKEIQTYEAHLDMEEVGSILEVSDGIARIHGLGNCLAGEMLEFSNGSSAWPSTWKDSIGA